MKDHSDIRIHIDTKAVLKLTLQCMKIEERMKTILQEKRDAFFCLRLYLS
jgi:hypothetical protein